MSNFKEFVAESLNEEKNWDIDDVLITIDSTSEYNLKKKFFEPLKVEYIDTTGAYSDEYKYYDGIIDYLNKNMGQDEANKLYTLVQHNLKSSIIQNFMKLFAKDKYIKKVK